MRKPNIDKLKADNEDLRESNKRLFDRVQSLINEQNELREENELLRGMYEEVVKKSSNTEANERVKTLEVVNKRQQEEIKRLREDCKEMAKLLQKYDELVEIALLVL